MQGGLPVELWFNADCSQAAAYINHCNGSATSTDDPWILDGLQLTNPDLEKRDRIALHILRLDRDLTVRNFTFRGYDFGIVLDRLDCDCTIRIENGSIMRGLEPDSWIEAAPWDSSMAERMIAVYAFPPLGHEARYRVEIQSLRTNDYEESVRLLRGGGARIEDLSADCALQGLHVNDQPEVWIARVTLRDCAEEALRLNGNDRVRIEDVTLEGARTGAYIESDTVENIVDLRRVFIAGSMQYGIFLNKGAARLTDSVLREDGDGRSWSSTEPCASAAVCLLHGSLVARNTSFEGNDAYAIHAIQADPSADARENWWGDAKGPRVRPAQDAADLPPVGAGNGDAVSEGVDFYPFLESPPR